jgi:hypothetical protein
LAALSDLELQLGAPKYPDGIVIYPMAFEKIAVDGICGRLTVEPPCLGDRENRSAPALLGTKAY